MKIKIIAIGLGIWIGMGITIEAIERRRMFADSVSWEYVTNHGDIDEVRNKNTGVHYYKYSFSSNANGFCPVYNSNGEVKITK